MANHLMIDIETLDTRPSAVVFQVGLIAFRDVLFGEPEGEIILEERLFQLDILPQIMKGRTVDGETVNWWSAQNPFAWNARNILTKCEAVFKNINSIVGNHGIGHIWANSPSFDCVIMRSLCEDMELNLSSPFPSFKMDQDIRTLRKTCDFLGMDTHLRPETTHNALQDCRDQVQEVLEMHRFMRSIRILQ